MVILVINFSFTLSLTDLSYRSDTAHQNDVNERNDDDCPALIGNFGQLTPTGRQPPTRRTLRCLYGGPRGPHIGPRHLK